MTYVKQSSFASLESTTAIEFMVEVITFDNESVIIYVVADNESEAMDLAAAQVDNADYAMVQGYSF